jgi:hypothetical protein
MDGRLDGPAAGFDAMEKRKLRRKSNPYLSVFQPTP